MITPDVPANEEARLTSLRRLGVLDTPAEDRFDRLTRVGALAFSAPMCLVSLVDADRQWFKSSVGVDAAETGRDISFCGHAILQEDALVVPDSLLDERFADNPLVTGEPHIRFYAGQPLHDAEGHRLGTFCVIDTEPRVFTDADRDLLAEMARLVEIELNSVGLEEAVTRASDSDRLHRSVIAALEEGVLVVGGNGLVEEVNDSAASILRMPVDQIEGRDLADLSTIPEFQWEGEDGEPLPAAERPLLRTLATGECVAGQIVGLRRSPTEVTWLSVNSRPIGEADDGRPLRAVLSFVDITHSREVDRMKTEFVSVVSHELRTPLTSIRGALGLLASGRMGAVEPEAKKMFEIAVSNTDRLIRLINDILDIERIESGGLTLHRVDVDLSGLVHQVVATIAPVAADEGVEVIARCENVRAWVDPDRIVQALTNLVGNAVKFSERGGRVEVTATRSGQEVILHVADNGRGIPVERQAAVFERFRQVDASDSREKGGTGLGLSICKEIAEQHGGRISLESTPGVGSTFSLTLPTLAGGEEAVKSAGEAVGDYVLVVEDDCDLARVLAEVLQAAGTDVVHTATVHEALVAASANPPSLMVLDVLLPDASGFELIDAFRRHDVLRSTPVAVYSALELREADRQRLRLGPTRFLTKSTVPPEAFSHEVLELMRA